jgi:ankyrin repeat protein
MYWRGICRYVIPILGRALEERLLNLETLNEIEYDYKDDGCKDGDFEYGLRLFHYACKSADLDMVKILCPSPTEINNPTYIPRSGSAAIHLAITSLKHPSNHLKVEGTKALLDFLISHSANINLQDNKGETVLYKAAMEGSYELVVHLLNYPQTVDIHTLSKIDNISAIVAAARYTPINPPPPHPLPSSAPQQYSDGDLCIKALLQMGSEYSPLLSITKEELKRIQRVARSLIVDDPNSAFARIPRATVAIQKWLEINPDHLPRIR